MSRGKIECNMSMDISKLVNVTDSIEGWLSHTEGICLYELVGIAPGDCIVEVGSWKGKSTAWLLTACHENDKTLWAIDHFKGSAEHHEQFGDSIDTYDEFLYNMRNVASTFDIGILSLMVLKENSRDAAEEFDNDSIGLIFLDASHDYESVKADLAAWLPKVMKGGIVACHDYHKNWPGVMKAVREVTFDKFVNVTGTVTWWFK